MTTTASTSDDEAAVSSPTPSKTTIKNRRLTYLNRSEYTSSASTQERLFPVLYERLILRHATQAERLKTEIASKQRTLTNVLLEAGDQMEKLQQRRDRTDDDRARDAERLEQEQHLVDITGDDILNDSEKSRALLEKMMRERFMAGGDKEFGYPTVDEDEQWDDWETIEEDIRTEYFAEETSEEEDVEERRVLTGQTGVQDY
jgi:hypothetical protein